MTSVPPAEIFVPGTIKPEEDYKEMELLSRRLGIPAFFMHIEVKSANPDGPTKTAYSGRSRTWNRNFWNSLYVMFTGVTSAATFGTGYLGLKRADASIMIITGYQYFCSPFYSSIGAVNYSAYGIVIGTDNSAESFEGYKLGTQILQGSAANQMVHAAQSTPGNAYTSGTKTWTSASSRLFNNNSGGTIVVAETGIYSYPSSGGFIMCQRDVLGTPVTVVNGGQITVTYTISLAFPA